MTTTTITPESRVGQIAAEHPLATRVFARHGIDFCCGGGKPLAEVCSQSGLDVNTMIAEIDKELAEPEAVDVQRWDQAPLGELIDHILTTYHVPLHEELPRLEAMMRKVHDVHGHTDTERFNELLNVYLGLKAELDGHMMKEEEILFPMIRNGDGAMAHGPVSVMLQEHDSAGEALRSIRRLTSDYVVPDHACNTWRALWEGFRSLEVDLHEHIHLENNILFPRALDS
jgi:regulator of cell morphogenesis and NO signaling